MLFCASKTYLGINSISMISLSNSGAEMWEIKWWKATCSHQIVGFCVRFSYSLVVACDDSVVGRRWLGDGGSAGRHTRPLWSIFAFVDDGIPGKGIFNQGTCMGIPWHTTRTKHTEIYESTKTPEIAANQQRPSLLLLLSKRASECLVGYQIFLLWSHKLINLHVKRLFFFHVHRANNGFTPWLLLPHIHAQSHIWRHPMFTWGSILFVTAPSILPVCTYLRLGLFVPLFPLQLFVRKYGYSKRSLCPGASVLLSTLGCFSIS